MEINNDNFYIKHNYISRLEPRYFDDSSMDLTDVIHQVDVYPFVAYLAEKFSCKNIIDLGCGSAAKLIKLYPKFEIIGIDYGTNIQYCKNQYKYGRWIDCDFEKIEDLPLSTEILRNSVIICADLIEHLVNPTHLLKILKTFLEHAPVCVISTPERDLVYGSDNMGPPANPHHVREWNMSELEKLLASKGFDISFIGLTFNNNHDLEKKTILAILNGRSGIVTKTTNYANFRVVAVMTTYNEEDIISSSIQHLIDQGLDVYVIDYWSTDNTYELAKQFEGKGVISIERFPPEGPFQYFYWKLLLKRVEEIARKIEADWFILHDVDEIRESPWNSMKLKDAIYLVDKAGYNVIDHTVITFHPVNNNYQTGTDFESYFRYYDFGKHPAYFVQLKAWKKTTQDISLAESGGHRVSFDNLKIFPYKFLLKHYPIRSQHHGEKKVLRERKPRFDPYEKSLGWQNHYDHIDNNHIFLRKPDELEIFDEKTFYKKYLVERLSGIGLDHTKH